MGAVIGTTIGLTKYGAANCRGTGTEEAPAPETPAPGASAPGVCWPGADTAVAAAAKPC